MKKLLKMGLLSLFLLTVMNVAVPALAHTADAPYVADLIAAQHYYAGRVLVWNDCEFLYVRYVANPGWQITETHLFVGTEPPARHSPGRFPYGAEYMTPRTCVTYRIPLADIDGCGTVFIAAHAVVNRPCNIYDETAWAFGPCHSTQFGPWGWYFWYAIQ